MDDIALWQYAFENKTKPFLKEKKEHWLTGVKLHTYNGSLSSSIKYKNYEPAKQAHDIFSNMLKNTNDVNSYKTGMEECLNLISSYKNQKLNS